jgi:preprotein translocase subunit SecE
MATEEDLEKAKDEAADDEAVADEASRSPSEQPTASEALVDGSSQAAAEGDSGAEEHEAAPMQLGYKRYVYAAFLAGAVLVGFLFAKIGHVSWYRLGQWKPELGEPKDELLFPLAGLVGVAVALYYWRRPDARQYADEVAEELSKVSWPSRKEVTSSTTVVVMTTIFATVFFALMDQFWKFVTDKIYSF